MSFFRGTWSVFWFTAKVGWYTTALTSKGIYKTGKWAWGLRSHKKEFEARFADGKKLKAGGFLKPGGIFVGYEGSKRVFLDPERSVIVFGQPGLGKTSMGIANILAMQDTPNIVALDPAGDFKKGVIKTLVARGYEIITVDFENPNLSAKYNAFAEVNYEDDFTLTRSIKSVCNLLISEGVYETDAGVHFKESAKNMLRSMVTARLLKYRDLADLGSIVQRLLVEKTARTDEFEAMRSHPHMLVKQGVEAYLSAGNKEKGSMDSTLSRKLEAFLDPSVSYISRGGDWSFREKIMGQRPVAVFIKLGLSGRGSGGPYARLMVGNCANAIRELYDRGKVSPNGVLFYLDEPFLMGDCQPLVDCVIELRKARCRVIGNFPDYQSVFDTLKEAAKYVVNCAWAISGGSNDIDLYSAAVKLAGKKKVVKTSVSKGYGESKTEHSEWEDLTSIGELQAMTPDELMVVGRGILWKGRKPYDMVNGVPTFN